MKPTQEQVIEWAREAGLYVDEDGEILEGDGWHTQTIFVQKAMTLAYEAGRAAENEATNAAYKERNQLVALLSTVFPSGKAKTAIEGWDEAWHGCVYIEFPWGQASWHYHDSDSWMFEHLLPYNKQWDGHTTEQKYAAIAAAIRARGQHD